MRKQCLITQNTIYEIIQKYAQCIQLCVEFHFMLQVVNKILNTHAFSGILIKEIIFNSKDYNINSLSVV